MPVPGQVRKAVVAVVTDWKPGGSPSQLAQTEMTGATRDAVHARVSLHAVHADCIEFYFYNYLTHANAFLLTRTPLRQAVAAHNTWRCCPPVPPLWILPPLQ